MKSWWGLWLVWGCSAQVSDPAELPRCSSQVEDLCHQFSGPVAEVACDRPMKDLDGDCLGQDQPISCKAQVIGPTVCQPVNANQTVWCCR